MVVERDESPAGVEGVGGEVGLAQEFLGEVRGADFAVGVAELEEHEEPSEGGGAELFVAGEEPAADPVERVVLATAVSGGGMLGPAADLVERRVGQADHVEVIDHQPRVGQPDSDGGGVGLVGVDHHVGDPGQPGGRLRAEPVGDRHGAASRENVHEAARIEVDDPGHQHGRVLGGGGQERHKRRARDLKAERRKLLELHYDDALSADLFKEEQARIGRELTIATAAAEGAIATLREITTAVERALEWAKDCHGAYAAGKPTVRRQMNQALFEGIWITEDGVERYELAEPLASLLVLGSYLRKSPVRLAIEKEERARDERTPVQEDGGLKETALVEVMGLEPTASSMRPKRSSQLSYTPAGIFRLARQP